MKGVITHGERGRLRTITADEVVAELAGLITRVARAQIERPNTIILLPGTPLFNEWRRWKRWRDRLRARRRFRQSHRPRL